MWIRSASLSMAALTLIACAARPDRYDDVLASFRDIAPPPVPREGRASKITAADLRAADGTLSRDALIRAATTQNPTLAASYANARAAFAEVPQRGALPDPTISYAFAPLSIADSETHFGQVIQIAQPLPFFGERGLASEVALAEAEASTEGYKAARLRLAVAAATLYDAYVFTHRALAITERHIALARDLKAAAEAQYTVGRATQQDPLAAESELAHLVHQKIMLESGAGRLAARINALLSRPPGAALPPPPDHRDIPPDLGRPVDALIAQALAQRPELLRLRAQQRARTTAVKLAQKERYPDFGVMGAYNSMWDATAHQLMVGVQVTVPLWQGARRAAVTEAKAQAEKTLAETTALADEIASEVAAAHLSVTESERIVEHYGAQLLPAARDRLRAARAGFVTGQNRFSEVIVAARRLNDLELEYAREIARLYTRRAKLARAVGQFPGFIAATEEADR